MRNALRRAARSLGLERGRQICPFDRRRIVSMIDAGLSYGQSRKDLGVSVWDIDLALRQVAEADRA